MSKFAKGINSPKMQEIFFLISPGNQLITLYQLSNLELLAVTVIEISSFLCQNLQRAITQKNNDFFIFTE